MCRGLSALSDLTAQGLEEENAAEAEDTMYLPEYQKTLCKNFKSLMNSVCMCVCVCVCVYVCVCMCVCVRERISVCV